MDGFKCAAQVVEEALGVCTEPAEPLRGELEDDVDRPRSHQRPKTGHDLRFSALDVDLDHTRVDTQERAEVAGGHDEHAFATPAIDRADHAVSAGVVGVEGEHAPLACASGADPQGDDIAHQVRAEVVGQKPEVVDLGLERDHQAGGPHRTCRVQRGPADVGPDVEDAIAG